MGPQNTHGEGHQDLGRLLPLAQAADRCGLSAWTLRRWAQQGRLPFVRMGTGRNGRLLIPERVVADIIAKGFRPTTCPPDQRIA